MDDNLPTPLEGLKETGPTPFLTKTYNIVEDSSTNNIVSWSRDNNSFIVWEPETFALIILPRCFKHKNFSSFVRQLNTYGFKKIDTERWEFANEYFLRGQRHLLKNIKRRKTSSQTQQTQTQSLEGCRFGLEGEIQGMRRERVDLLIELMRLRRKQESVKTNLHLMEEKLKVAEMKQELMMDFLLRTMKNPSFLQSLRKRKLHLMEEKLKVTEMKQELMMDFLLRTMKNPSFLQSLRKRKHQGNENREQGQEMISHVVEDHENFIKVEPEEFGNDDELHIASMEDQEQDEIEMEMDSEGLWKGFVLSEEMCVLGDV